VQLELLVRQLEEEGLQQLVAKMGSVAATGDLPNYSKMDYWPVGLPMEAQVITLQQKKHGLY